MNQVKQQQNWSLFLDELNIVSYIYHSLGNLGSLMRTISSQEYKYK